LLSKTERIFGIEQPEADRKRNRSDEGGHTVEGPIRGGKGKPHGPLAPRQNFLADTRSLPEAAEHGSVGVGNTDADQ
jgi:hypothetical protein